MTSLLAVLVGWCLLALLFAWGWSRFMRRVREAEEEIGGQS